MRKILQSTLFIATALLIPFIGSAQLQNPGGLTGQEDQTRVINTAMPFLTISPEARAGAMGEAGVATSPDANAMYWNAAKLAFIDNDYGASISYNPWLAQIVNDMSLSFLSGYYKLSKEQTIGVSFRYFDLGSITFLDNPQDPGTQFNPKEFSISGAYARQLTSHLSVSLTARYARSNLIGDYQSSSGDNPRAASAVAADVGVYFQKDIMLASKNANLALAGQIANIGNKVTYSSQDNEQFIPINLRLGSALTTYMDPFNSITLALDFNKLLVPSPPVYDQNGNIVKGKDPNRSIISGIFGSFNDAPDGFSEEMKEITTSVGAEYWYNKIFALRAGYFYESKSKGGRQYFTTGVGFRYQVFAVDFSYLVTRKQNNPLAETLRFTLGFNFNNTKQNKSITAD